MASQRKPGGRQPAHMLMPAPGAHCTSQAQAYRGKDPSSAGRVFCTPATYTLNSACCSGQYNRSLRSKKDVQGSGRGMAGSRSAACPCCCGASPAAAAAAAAGGQPWECLQHVPPARCFNFVGNPSSHPTLAQSYGSRAACPAAGGAGAPANARRRRLPALPGGRGAGGGMSSNICSMLRESAGLPSEHQAFTLGEQCRRCPGIADRDAQIQVSWLPFWTGPSDPHGACVAWRHWQWHVARTMPP